WRGGGGWPGGGGGGGSRGGGRSPAAPLAIGSRALVARRTWRPVLPGTSASWRAAGLVAPWSIGAWRRRAGCASIAIGSDGRPGRVPVRALLALLPALRFLVEPRARVLVLSARAPVAVALLAGLTRTAFGGVLRVGRFPQPSAGEPFHVDVLVGALQLGDRRQQFLPIAGSKGRRLVVDEDRPVSEARRPSAI